MRFKIKFNLFFGKYPYTQKNMTIYLHAKNYDECRKMILAKYHRAEYIVIHAQGDDSSDPAKVGNSANTGNSGNSSDIKTSGNSLPKAIWELLKGYS